MDKIDRLYIKFVSDSGNEEYEYTSHGPTVANALVALADHSPDFADFLRSTITYLDARHTGKEEQVVKSALAKLPELERWAR